MTYYPRCSVLVDAYLHGGLSPLTFVATPTDISIDRNGPRKADTADITLPYRDFPLDPRLISAAHVHIFLADVGAAGGNVELLGSNLRFQGLVDVPESTLSSDDSSTKFTCRDYTAIYLDLPWRSVADAAGAEGKALAIPPTATLAQFVESVRAKVSPNGDRPPTVFDDPTLGAVSLAQRAAVSNLAMQDGDTAWDVLTVVCEWYALVPSWDIDPVAGPVLRIRGAYSPTDVRATLQYGRDVESLQFRRNLRAPERKAVRLSAWNPRSGTVITAFWPREGAVRGDTPALGEGGSPTVLGIRRVQYNVEGDYSPRDLIEMARRIYEDQAQGRIVGTIATPHMRDIDSTDLLRLANGARVICSIDAAIDTVPPATLPPEVRAALDAARSDVSALTVEFFVKSARHSWDVTEGYRVEVEFTDFLLDRVEPAGR